MKTLMVTDEAAFTPELMGDDSFRYGDNGGDSDGNAWLPQLNDISPETEQAVVEAGYGQMVEAKYANDEAMVKYLGFAPVSDDTDFDDEYFIDQLKEAADEKTAAWAHFGAYGAGGSTWVFVELG